MCTPQGFEGDECHPFSHKVHIISALLYIYLTSPSWLQWCIVPIIEKNMFLEPVSICPIVRKI